MAVQVYLFLFRCLIYSCISNYASQAQFFSPLESLREPACVQGETCSFTQLCSLDVEQLRCVPLGFLLVPKLSAVSVDYYRQPILTLASFFFFAIAAKLFRNFHHFRRLVFTVTSMTKCHEKM